MKIEEGKFYFIKDSYFDLFKDYKLMQNKENGTKRPCYLCFRDTNEKYIISKYKINGRDVDINFELKNKVIETAKIVLDLYIKYNGIILFNDVYKMIEILEKESVLI